jgi:membrane dipeptidase
MIMSYYTEQDPLLPRENRSPEIHGSRAQSINNVTVAEEKEAAESRPWSLNGFPAIILAICFFGSIYMFLVPYLDNYLGEERPEPRTIEERVNRILSDTPLIGKLNLLLGYAISKNSRWP